MQKFTAENKIKLERNKRQIVHIKALISRISYLQVNIKKNWAICMPINGDSWLISESGTSTLIA